MNTVVFDNTRVLTCDAGHTVAEAIAIRAGEVLAVGASGTVRASAGPDSRIIDLNVGTPSSRASLTPTRICCTSAPWPSPSSTSAMPARMTTSRTGSPPARPGCRRVSGS